MLPSRLFAALAVALFSTGNDAADGHERDRMRRVEWPSGDFPTLQSAIDAAVDGGIVMIRDGVHEIAAPVTVRGKRLRIEGAGSGRHRSNVTRLVGRPPAPVTDERGNVILRGDAVVGLLNVLGADVEVRRLSIEGFDAGLTARDERGRRSLLRVEDVMISNTGRGILAHTDGMLTISESTIHHTLWNGVSISSFSLDPNSFATFFTNLVTLFSNRFAGYYVGPNTFAFIANQDIHNAFGPGIAVDHGRVSVVTSHIHHNFGGGILLQQPGGDPLIRESEIDHNGSFGLAVLGAVGHVNVQDNLIADTSPRLEDGLFGDGLIGVVSEISSIGNQITGSARAGLSNFGGLVHLGDTRITCSGFDLEGEPFFGFPFEFEDLGQGDPALANLCGCPTANQTCVAVSAGLEAPSAIQAEP